MAIIDFLKTLPSSNDTQRVTDGIRNLRRVIDNSAIPALEAIKAGFPEGYKFKNDQVAQIDRVLVKAVKNDIKLPRQGGDSIDYILFTMQQLTSNLSVFEDVAIRIFKGKSFSNAGMAYNKGNVLQYIEAADYFVRFTRRYYNLLTAFELAELSGAPSTEGVGPDDLANTMNNLQTYASVMIGLSGKVSETKKTIDSLSTMTISDNESSVIAVVGRKGVNPWGFSDLPWPLSLVFRFQMNDANSVLDDYRTAEQECKAIECRIILIQEAIDNNGGDAALEKRLDAYNSRLMSNKRTMEKIKEKYGIADR